MHVFIGGLHRSGTSLLHRMLCEHPEITGFSGTGVPEDEGQHLQSVYPSAKQFGGPGSFAEHPEAYMDETHPLMTDGNRRALNNAWNHYWDNNKRVRVEKSPPNLIRSRFFQSLFPQARFIFIVRHPLAVAMATQKWNPRPVNELLAHWEAAHQILEQDLPHLIKAHVLRYEDLVQDTDITMECIYDFLELTPHKNTISVASDANAPYLEAGRKMVTKADVLPLCDQYGYQMEAPFVKEEIYV